MGQRNCGLRACRGRVISRWWLPAMNCPSDRPNEPALPEWVPADRAHEAHFASRVQPGRYDAPMGPRPVKRRRLMLEDYERGILAGDIGILSRAITLVESHLPEHEARAQQLLERLMPRTGGAIRVGITGVPGAGKSTLIELLGSQLCEAGRRVAVLAVDPSSSVTGGSILGDKTRMQELGRNPRAFIRPSPSAGSLGGVARKSRETMLLCEAAGFDVILVETVGVGQNEITVRSMVDFFLLIMIAGAGDELQGIKKGVIEIADLLAVNKADGDNVRAARLACAEYRRVLGFLQPATAGWKTRCVTCSSFDPDSLLDLWRRVEDFERQGRQSGSLEERRRQQSVQWMQSMIEEELKNRFYRDPAVSSRLRELRKSVEDGKLPVAAAVKRLMEPFSDHSP